jgi:hypothetical protein
MLILNHCDHLCCHPEPPQLRTFMLHVQLFVEQNAALGALSTHLVVELIH